MSDEPQLLIVGGTRPRGRPKSPDPTVPLTSHLPASYYDRITRYALKHDISVSAAARRAIQHAMDHHEAFSRLKK